MNNFQLLLEDCDKPNKKMIMESNRRFNSIKLEDIDKLTRSELIDRLDLFYSQNYNCSRELEDILNTITNLNLEDLSDKDPEEGFYKNFTTQQLLDAFRILSNNHSINYSIPQLEEKLQESIKDVLSEYGFIENIESNEEDTIELNVTCTDYTFLAGPTYKIQLKINIM